MALANLLGGIAVLLLGSCIVFSSSRLPYQAEYGPGPGFVPLWIGVALIACGMWTTIKSLRRYREEKGRFFQPKTCRVVFIFLTLVVTLALVPVLGLASALALFAGFTMRTMGRHGWILCLFVTMVTAVAVRMIFGHFLDIPLPKGLIGV